MTSMRTGGPAVVVEGLAKAYGPVEAVRGVDLTIEAGEVFALLGPNGAGKTTTLEILEGYRTRDSGAVQVLGEDPATAGRGWRERVGVVLQATAVDPYLKAREAIVRNAGYYPRPRDADEVLDLVGLTEQAGTRVINLSGGQQRRLDVALGLVGNPELLFLDEPTTGFDPSARRGAWELVHRLTGTGTTIVLTTHYMDEAQALAHRVAVLADGRIVACGPPDTIGGRDRSTTRIRFRLPAGVSAAELPFPTVEVGGVVQLETDDEVRALHSLTGWALAAGHRLDGLTVERPSLEDIYLRLTGAAPEDGS